MLWTQTWALSNVSSALNQHFKFLAYLSESVDVGLGWLDGRQDPQY